MNQKKITISNQFNILRFGNKLFLLGSFFLPTAPFISAIFLLPSLIIGSIKRNDKFFGDKWNYPLVAVSILMFVSCIVHTSKNYSTFDLDTSLSFIGLFNWIPFFWCFWGFQPYLINKKLRKKFLFIVLGGTIPVLISGLSQYFFRLYGPFEFLNGLIIWYQRPIDNETQGLTAVFNIQPYAAAWLCMIFYISLAFTLVKENNKIKVISSFLITIFVLLSTILTYSRNSIISILLFLFFFIKSKNFVKFIIIFFLTILYFYFIFGQNLLLESLKNLYGILPYALYVKINNILNWSIYQSFPRVFIWDYSIDFISQKPIFGWGAGSFTQLLNPNDLNFIDGQHPHNLPLEIALSYGLPSAFILTATSLLITFKNFKKDFKINLLKKFSRENIFDTAWRTSFGIFLFIHLFDISYFDARISVFSWILLSGMRNMLKEK